MSPRASQPNKLEQVPTLRESRYSQSLERGLAVLGCFTPKHPALGISEIADDLGMSRSTTHRYAITLVALGFLEQDASRKYRLGLRVTDLGMAALNSTGLYEPARQYMEELRQYTSFTVSLSVLYGTEILYVARAQSFRQGQYKVDLNVRLGSRLPAYCTAMGKVLLANVSDSERDELIMSITLLRRGPNSIATKVALRMELDHVRKKGTAVNDEELASGLISMAVPVYRDTRKVVAALNMAAHTSIISIQDMVDQFGSHLLNAASHISARLDLRPDGEVSK